ncbi:CYSTM domain-containing protein [Citrus sinensis]|uniref:cysteine-rich and transmembrane domain-containing protein WIH1 isoform X2 n=1 Tax=Citrus clementina TaxID=85681 RepID=UPI0003D76837|nr:cysteine-rich and transmembrane domain-containing protein WIH1 isoform X2 [Citrus x clementina]XP_006481357.1 protein CYSTEINE-RICH TRANSMEMBRANE MODULE 6-like isoform X2 [Citrus sinensis]KAH9673723.1 CYSTM domain-containing protein [Citrus sinensis]
MSSYNQNQSSAYPPPPPSTTAGLYVAAPPPAGYPTKDGDHGYAQNAPVETKSRGDGFWKGCCAGLCCCCALDACF